MASTATVLTTDEKKRRALRNAPWAAIVGVAMLSGLPYIDLSEVPWVMLMGYGFAVMLVSVSLSILMDHTELEKSWTNDLLMIVGIASAVVAAIGAFWTGYAIADRFFQ